ncbi:hypothetical protein [Corallococcus exiguus]|uniref:hypothetical protein n=1 Tax=Corallococcus exiguus TaxID=83462 RepID=UPI0026B23F17
MEVSDFGLALSDLPSRVASTVHRPQGDAFYSSPETLLMGLADARSDLFALGNVMLELATGKNLLDAPDSLTQEVKDALSDRQLAVCRRAIKRARSAGSPPAVEDAIWRAATYTQADLDALVAPLPQAMRVMLTRLLQRAPANRYQSAREFLPDLYFWQGEEKLFGPKEAEAELKGLMQQTGEALVELGIRAPRGSTTPQEQISTN